MFSGLRQGTALFILDKSEEPKLYTGYVESVSAPHPQYKTYNPAASFNANLQTVVDIMVKIGNEKKEFVGIPSGSIIHSYGDYVISETKESMAQEVDSMMQASKTIVQNIDQHKQNIIACESILKQLNPIYAKEQERDQAIDSLTEQVNSMQDTLTRLESLLTKQNKNEND